MRTFPVIIVLKDGSEISDRNHQLMNTHHVNITSCQASLNERLLGNQTSTIYVVEEANKVFCETPDGTTIEFLG